MLNETEQAIIVFSLFVIVAQLVMILVLFLKNKDLRIKLHEKTFEDLLQKGLMTNEEINILRS